MRPAKAAQMVTGLRTLALGLAAVMFAMLPAAPVRAQSGIVNWIFAADIHLDPFADPALVNKLAAAPPGEWKGIIAGTTLATYGKDSNPALFESALAAMAAVKPRPSAILIDGDFLAHHFREMFDKTASEHDDAAFERFADKTIAYVALRFNEVFPDIPVLPALGNDDSYCGDYKIDPSGQFLARMARVWEPLVARAGDASAFVRTFSTSGHYTLDLRSSGVHLVVPNSVYWSGLYKNECGASGAMPSDAELAWLNAELDKPVPAGLHTWVATHIPPGIDVFNSIGAVRPRELYSEFAETRVPQIIAAHRSTVTAMVTGHMHFATFRLIGGATGVPVIVIPAVSPIFTNNPGFFLAQVAPSSGTVVDFTAYSMHGLQLLKRPAPAAVSWAPEYRFSTAYGLHGVTAASVAHLEGEITRDVQIRSLFFQNFSSGSPIGLMVIVAWRAYRCSITALDAKSYTTCLGGNTPH